MPDPTPSVPSERARFMLEGVEAAARASLEASLEYGFNSGEYAVARRELLEQRHVLLAYLASLESRARPEGEPVAWIIRDKFGQQDGPIWDRDEREVVDGVMRLLNASMVAETTALQPFTLHPLYAGPAVHTEEVAK